MEAVVVYKVQGKLLEFVSSLLLRKIEQEDPPKYQTKVNFKGILMLIGSVVPSRFFGLLINVVSNTLN